MDGARPRAVVSCAPVHFRQNAIVFSRRLRLRRPEGTSGSRVRATQREQRAVAGAMSNAPRRRFDAHRRLRSNGTAPRLRAHGRDRHAARDPMRGAPRRTRSAAHSATASARVPDTPSTERASSRSGPSRSSGSVMASVRRTPRIGLERGFEHVRVGKISPRGRKRNRRLRATKLPPRSAVEKRAEDARRVEIRKTEPIDGAVARHQRGRPAVADQRVIADAARSRPCAGGCQSLTLAIGRRWALAVSRA